MIRALRNFFGVILVWVAGVLILISGYIIADDKVAGDVYEVIRNAVRD